MTTMTCEDGHCVATDPDCAHELDAGDHERICCDCGHRVS